MNGHDFTTLGPSRRSNEIVDFDLQLLSFFWHVEYVVIDVDEPRVGAPVWIPPPRQLRNLLNIS